MMFPEPFQELWKNLRSAPGGFHDPHRAIFPDVFLQAVKPMRKITPALYGDPSSGKIGILNGLGF
jgi:hypothetical protein